ncbi:linear amide C-N hydrolase [Microbacterium sp. NE2HP2]|nr:linear amide C-N hydrolase [Microbacterium plantarum]MDD7945775.1 linear amide C-N hydrolase [Microbacterium plantarum]
MLGRFETVDEVEAALAGVTIVDVSFSEAFPASPLHWIIADRSRSITVESVREGLRVSPELPPDRYSRGMGAIGLPGDLSSSSRFVKAAFTRMNSVAGESESESISQFFQILGSVAQQCGCVHVGEEGTFEITIYSSCCNTDTGVYYYTTYENSQVSGVDMHREDLDADALVHYPLVTGQQINVQN